MIAERVRPAQPARMTGADRSQTLLLWLCLKCAKGIGPKTATLLLGRFGGIDALFAAPPAAFDVLRGGQTLREALHAPEVRAQAERWFDLQVGLDYRAITRADADYPSLLLASPDAPVVLFVRSAPSAPAAGPVVAMVGSRRPSEEGSHLASTWAKEFARAGIAVASGLARGIDGAAHRGALAGKGATIAVLGSGPDRIYPPEHETLAEAIVAGGGALVSQFWPGTGPERGLFPARNATIAGLSDAVVVVEAAEDSGALGTVAAARALGRPVFALPGPLSRATSAGSNALLKEGAQIALSAGDVIGALGCKATPPAAPLLLEPELEPLYARIEPSGVSVDRLAQELAWPVPVVLERLLTLELDGLIRQLPGQRYARRVS